MCEAATIYFLVWDVLEGGGCGPSGNSSSAPIFAAAPLVLPVLAGAIILIAGTTRKWRSRTIAMALLTTIGLAALGEIFVFLLEFGAHHCGE
jgi:hypothetical protein